MNERLDPALLQELKMLMEDEFGMLLEAYLDDSAQQLREISDAWEDGDLERLRRGAHSLKGASSNLGAVALAALCADLEQLARQGCREAVPEALDRVRTELREVRDAVMAMHDLH